MAFSLLTLIFHCITMSVKYYVADLNGPVTVYPSYFGLSPIYIMWSLVGFGTLAYLLYAMFGKSMFRWLTPLSFFVWVFAIISYWT